jgi:uncharacterized membrane protein YeiH
MATNFSGRRTRLDQIIYILELIGTVAFAVSGAVVAIKKETDVFGVVFIAITTAVGGGIFRDVLIGNLPPVAFTHYEYVSVATVTALAIFLFAYIRRDKKHHQHWEAIDRVNNVFDAIGLGAFTVIGMNTAIVAGLGGNVFLVIFLGMITGIGGGILRDTLVRDIPFVLTQRIYAVASLVGAIGYYILYWIGVHLVVCALVGIVVIFAIRMISSKFKWHLPRVRLQ